MNRALVFPLVLAAAASAIVAQSSRIHRSHMRALALSAQSAVVSPAAAHVNRAAIRAMEESFDKRVLTASPDTPFDLLGTTRGVYLSGYGAVFTR